MISKGTFWTTLVLMLIAGVAVNVISARNLPVVTSTNLENIPMRIEDFSATEDYFDPSIYDELDADLHVYRHYRSDIGQQIDLYIGYYGTAKGGRTPHNPYSCLPASGWGIEKAYPVKIKSTNIPDGAVINYILARKGTEYETALHWYQSNKDQILPNGFKQNLHRFIGRILYNRNEGAFVRVTVRSSEEKTQDAYALAEWFSKLIIETMPHYWPVENPL